jgi:hypothetical protein
MNYGQKDLRQLARQLAALQAKDHGTDARDGVFRALRAELRHTPLWLLIHHGLKVRGLEFRLYYPKPRPATVTGLSALTGRPKTGRKVIGPGRSR